MPTLENLMTGERQGVGYGPARLEREPDGTQGPLELEAGHALLDQALEGFGS